jgi:hypothetical protein
MQHPATFRIMSVRPALAPAPGPSPKSAAANIDAARRSAEFFAGPRKESPSVEVFSCKDSGLRLAALELKGPKDNFFSADEQRLHVNNCDFDAKTVMRRPRRHGRSLGESALFIDRTSQIRGEEPLDGLKPDQRDGNSSSFALRTVRLGMRP